MESVLSLSWDTAFLPRKRPGGKASSMPSQARRSLPPPRLAPGSVSDGLSPSDPRKPSLTFRSGAEAAGWRPPRAPPRPTC